MVGQYIEGEIPRIFEFVRELFEVSPPEPILEIGNFPKGVFGPSVHSTYKEGERKIIFDPTGLELYVAEFKELGIRIEPQETSERAIAYQLAQHCHSYLNDFTVVDIVNNHFKETWENSPHPQNPSDASHLFVSVVLPYARSYAIPTFAQLRMASEFGHIDIEAYLRGYYRKMEDAKEDAQEVIGRIEFSKLLVLPVVTAIGSWLAKSWDEDKTISPKDIIRAPLTELDEKSVSQAVEYIDSHNFF